MPTFNQLSDRPKHAVVSMYINVTDFLHPFHPEAFEYKRIPLGNESKETKGKRQNLEKCSDLDERRIVSYFKTRIFNLNQLK